MGEDKTTATEDTALDREAFMKRVEGHLDPAYRLATVILMDTAAAEDAVHAAAMEAWAGYRRANGEVISFRTWFLGLVAARCVRLRRWRAVTFRRSELGRVGGPRDAVAGLRLAGRAALFCHHSLDLPEDEVARVLHTSPARAHTRIARAADQVRAELERQEEERDA
jgi:DNA-directed RNA polymerase specialized sigma24 family protein